MSRNEQSAACNTSSHLFVEPDVLHAPIVDDTVDHHRPALYRRLPAIGEAVVEYDRAGPVLCQLSFDLPHQLPTRSRVGFHRLKAPGDKVIGGTINAMGSFVN